MTQIDSDFEEVITLNTAATPDIDDGCVESAANVAQFAQARAILATYTNRRFEERRCPICGRYACGGC